MYKIEIDISDWGGDEKVNIETSDFDKIEIIREFIEFQKDHGWAVDYDVVTDEDEEVDGIDEEVEEEEEEEEEEDEPATVSTYVITKIED